MKIIKGVIAIDCSVTGADRLVLVKGLSSTGNVCTVKDFSGTFRYAKKRFLTAIMKAPEGTKTVTEVINSQPRKVMKKVLGEL